MRRSLIALVLLAPTIALAQGKTKGRAPQTFTLTKETHTGAEDVARARFAAGDCKGAIDAFDVAIEHSIEPAFRRDRGICHEKMGDVFPAIDDYRAYIAARPQAPDAENIRARLARLEGYTPPREGEEPPPETLQTRRTLTEIEHDRDLRDQADTSALRLGKGWMLGAFVGLRTIGGAYGSSNYNFGQRAGGFLTSVLSKNHCVVLELGWAWSGASFDIIGGGTGNGPSFYLGYELKLPLDPYGSHALFFGAALGWERYVGTVGGVIPVAFDGIAPRGRFGYRFTIGSAFALQTTIDAGSVTFWNDKGGKESTSLQLGGTFGLVLGF